MFYELRVMIDVTLADGFLTVVHGTVVDIHVCVFVRFLQQHFTVS